MAERFTIIVAPPSRDHVRLTVEDAMRQVLDAMQLLQLSGGDKSDHIVWRLIRANTNSPFTVVSEAQPHQSGVDVDYLARRQKSGFEQNCRSLQAGQLPEAWADNKAREVAIGFIERSRNGVSKTRIILDPDNEVEFTPSIAAHAAVAFAEPEVLEVKPQTRYGSIEGTFVNVGQHYNQPAIQVRERLTGKQIWCLVDDEHRRRISEKANFDDVWANRRVRIRGTLEYDKAGHLQRVHVGHMTHVMPRHVQTDEIRDPDFTDGLSPSDHVNRLREGCIE